MLNAPTGLLCQLMAKPDLTRIQTPHPLLGWIVNDTRPDCRQMAYRIQAARLPEQLENGDCWDSGRVESADSINVRYAGVPLAQNSGFCWRVRMWNQRGEVSPWSVAQTVRTGSFATGITTEGYPLQQTANPAAEIVEKGSGHWFVAFERAAFATLRFTMTTPASGATVTIHLGEELAASHTVEREPRGHIRYRRIAVGLRPGEHCYTIEIPPDERNTGPDAIRMPAALGEVLPFRYVEFENAPAQPVAPEQLMAHYPFDDEAARFNCADETLNAVWEICRYTIKATTFCGVYVDGDRERIPYEGDAYINQLGHYAVDREFTLARHTHELLMRKPTWPTEWILHSVLMAWADYEHTGSDASLHRCYVDLQAKALVALARADGLISTETGLATPAVYQSIHLEGHPFRDLVDWPPAGTDPAFGQVFGPKGERDGHEMKAINTVVNAFHYRALVLMGRIAAVVGEAKDAAFYISRAALVHATINTLLFDEDRGIYVDGEGSGHASLHANMFPLAFGLVPEERRASVIAFIKTRGMACSVYGAQHLLDALYESGEAEHAFALLTATHDRSWWNMIAVGSTMTLEAWDWRYKQNLDWNHAWGAAPANIIPRYILGVRPLEPGFSRILIAPQPAKLAAAAGLVPTIRGPVQVTIEQDAGVFFRLEVTLPGNTRGEVRLPAPGVGVFNLTLDGRKAVGPFGDLPPAVEIGSGPHVIEWRSVER